ncbi:MAG: integrase core domain-containing protein, partial [Candidatus Omnitrophica bacterium]|nr:integrase core domain-containing protein [Candidatus Omnitrophota bacterium]
RFNRTLEEEFLQLGNYIDDVESFNNLLGEWLIEYNFNRPHQSLGYLTPIEFLEEKKKFDKNKNICNNELDENEKVFTMYSTYTKI